MSDNKPNFHETAIKSSLFKGRGDWYFCFLKSERIAHVLTVLAESVPESGRGELLQLSRTAGILPKTVAHFAAGAVGAPAVLAALFALLSALRLAQTSGAIGKENAQILLQECEALIEKFSASVRLSPFASADDFAVPRTDEPAFRLGAAGQSAEQAVKDSKGHTNIKTSEGQKTPLAVSKGQSDRAERILDFVLKNKGVSIKDIRQLPDPALKNCSEKTIQRELSVLVSKGLIQKAGERRWSVYLPA